MRNTHSTTNPPTTTPHLVYSVDLCAVLSRSVVSDSFRPHGLWRARLLCLRRFSRPEYWSGMPCPFAGELSNPGIELPNPGLPHCRRILYHLSHQGSCQIPYSCIRQKRKTPPKLVSPGPCEVILSHTLGLICLPPGGPFKTFLKQGILSGPHTRH